MSHMSHWVEDADARKIRRGATFLAADEWDQHLHLSAVATKIAELWHHSVTAKLAFVHHGSDTRH